MSASSVRSGSPRAISSCISARYQRMIVSGEVRSACGTGAMKVAKASGKMVGAPSGLCHQSSSKARAVKMAPTMRPLTTCGCVWA